MRIATLTAAAVLLVDQASKYAVVHALNLDQKLRIDVLPPWLSFRMAWNQGINFGLFAQSADLMRWMLIALAVAISVWVWIWVRRDAQSRYVQMSAGLLIGGAMGNVIDRILYGAVADFLNMGLPGFDNPYSFNIADIAIFAGAIGLVLFTGREKTP
jgi:signal peptidase II